MSNQARKTIDRETIVSRANAALAMPDLPTAERRAIFTLTTGILNEGNSYKGFCFNQDYLSDDEIQDSSNGVEDLDFRVKIL